MQSSMKNETRNMWLLILALTAVVLLRSPMFVNGLPGLDSGVFLSIGMEIQQGSVPYVDTFDHKGPLIFLINWLGLAIGGWRGIAVFEACAIAAALGCMFRTARLCTDWLTAAAITSLCAFGIVRFYGGGNLTEEYALPWIAMANLIFLRFFLQRRLHGWEAVLLGFGLAMVMALRPNMIAVWAIGYPVTIFLLRRDGRCSRFLLLSILGFLAGAAPFFFWFNIHHALQAWWDAYLVFNMQYAAGMTLTGFQRVKAFFYFAAWGAVECFAFCGWAMWRRKEKRTLAAWASLAMLFCTLLSMSMSGMTFAHYGAVMVPLWVFPLAIGASFIESYFDGARGMIRWNRVCCISMMLFVAFIVSFSYRHHVHDAIENVQARNISSYIRENSDVDDRISVWGSYNILYAWSQRRPASFYSYQMPIHRIRPQVMDRYFAELEAVSPKMVVLAAPADARMEAFLSEHAYEKLDEMPLKGGTVEIYRCP